MTDHPINQLSILEKGPYQTAHAQATVGMHEKELMGIPADAYFERVQAEDCYNYMCPSELKVKIQNLATYLLPEGQLFLRFTYGKKHLHDGVKQHIRFDQTTFRKFFERLQDLTVERIEEVFLEKDALDGIAERKSYLEISLKKTRKNNRKITCRQITDPQDPRIQDFRTRRDVQAKRKGHILIDSEKCVVRLLKSGVKVQKVLGLQDYILKYDQLLEVMPEVDIYEARLPVMEQIINGKIHQGLMAIAERPQDQELCEMGSRILVLDGLNDGHNVGCIVRSAHAFGFRDIISDNHGCSPLVRRAVRVSMGSIFQVNTFHSQELESDLNKLKHLGYQIVGAENYGSSVNVSNLVCRDKLVLIIGNEDRGIHPSIREICDHYVKIPISKDIDSLNAATAATLLMYELGKS